MKTLRLVILCLLCSCTVTAYARHDTVVLSPDLYLYRLTESVWVHVSYLDAGEFGRVPCNGLLYVVNDSAILFDTPHNDSLTMQLATYTRDSLGASIAGVVVNHFHQDCLGGLGYLHALGVPSYAHQTTCNLAKRDSAVCPLMGFEDELTVMVNNSPVILWYPGSAHTSDNIVAYIPAEQVLFGGCMVKAIGWDRGNVADADVKSWPRTIRKVKRRYGKHSIIVPGHGAVGGKELLSSTIKLFRKG